MNGHVLAGWEPPGSQNDGGRSSLAEIHELSAVRLRDALKSGELSALQAADHFLRRIEEQNPHLGAFITVTVEQARRDAAASTSATPSAAGAATRCPRCTACPSRSRT